MKKTKEELEEDIRYYCKITEELQEELKKEFGVGCENACWDEAYENYLDEYEEDEEQ